jgi:hypothetical protein
VTVVRAVPDSFETCRLAAGTRTRPMSPFAHVSSSDVRPVSAGSVRTMQEGCTTTDTVNVLSGLCWASTGTVPGTQAVTNAAKDHRSNRFTKSTLPRRGRLSQTAVQIQPSAMWRYSKICGRLDGSTGQAQSKTANDLKSCQNAGACGAFLVCRNVHSPTAMLEREVPLVPRRMCPVCLHLERPKSLNRGALRMMRRIRGAKRAGRSHGIDSLLKRMSGGN